MSVIHQAFYGVGADSRQGVLQIRYQNGNQVWRSKLPDRLDQKGENPRGRRPGQIFTPGGKVRGGAFLEQRR